MSKKILQFIKDQQVEYIDLRFTDTKGKEQHISIPAKLVDEDFLQDGKTFDGSSIAGWKAINESDMILKVDVDALFCLDPFAKVPTLILRCDVIDPKNMQGYDRDPRSIAKKAEAYLKKTGIADEFLVGPEPEFFIFDEVHWSVDMAGASYQVDSLEAAWNSNKAYAEGNYGHRPGIKGGYFPVPPVDSSQDLRTKMCQILERMGITVEAHHHEVATANQNEIATRRNSLTHKADELQLYKYVVHNVCHLNGKTATFMPKPLVGDNGSGMHCHQSLSKDGKNIFAGTGYANLSDEALFFIGGIIHHAKAINAFTNPATNSYKRLVPGFEAPVLLAYSSCNRSASIRVPLTNSNKARRIEVRFPDPAANPYLAFAAMLMAGLDGIAKRLSPGQPMDQDLYELSEEEQAHIPKVAHSLEEALLALKKDYDFLLHGHVFTEDMLDAYIRLKLEEVKALNMTTHPLEFKMYYSV